MTKTKKAVDNEDKPPFRCSSPNTPHVWRRRSGKWQIAQSCPGDFAHDALSFSGVLDGRRLTEAVWRRGDLRDVPALRGKRETGHSIDQVL